MLFRSWHSRYGRKGRNEIRLERQKDRRGVFRERQKELKEKMGPGERRAANKKSPGKGAGFLIAVLAAAAVLAALRGGKIPGNYNGCAPEIEKNMETEKNMEIEENMEMEDPVETGEAEKTEETKAGVPLPVNEEEEALLKSLYQVMEKKELDQAAEILNSQEELLKTLVQETLGGKKYLYWQEETAGGLTGHMKELTGETEGRGLAVTRFNTVFYGEFSGGKPEGDCTAVQADRKSVV